MYIQRGKALLTHCLLTKCFKELRESCYTVKKKKEHTNGTEKCPTAVPCPQGQAQLQRLGRARSAGGTGSHVPEPLAMQSRPGLAGQGPLRAASE